MLLGLAVRDGFHFLGTVVPLCTPHILVDIVVEIDMGTQVITHSPNAIHFAAHIVAIYVKLRIWSD